MVAVRAPRRLGAPAEPGDEQRQPQRRDVREQVPRIREQGQRVRVQPAQELGHEQQRRDRERDPQAARLVLARAGVVVMRVVVTGVRVRVAHLAASRAAIRAHSRIASVMLSDLARPVPAMSLAVP